MNAKSWQYFENVLSPELVKRRLDNSLENNRKINSKSIQKVFIYKVQILLLTFLFCYKALKLSGSSANLSSTLTSLVATLPIPSIIYGRVESQKFSITCMHIKCDLGNIWRDSFFGNRKTKLKNTSLINIYLKY